MAILVLCFSSCGFGVEVVEIVPWIVNLGFVETDMESVKCWAYLLWFYQL